MRLAAIIAFIVLLLLALLYYTPSVTPTPTPPSTSPTPASPPASQSAVANRQSAIESAAPQAAAFPINTPSTDIAADLRLVSDLLGTFRSNFPRTGNPTGTNAEITATLTGHNKLRFAFVSPGHPAINATGELCDRWGTPFFFHAESSTRMEIRSAGPDKKMWTDDDATFAP